MLPTKPRLLKYLLLLYMFKYFHHAHLLQKGIYLHLYEWVILLHELKVILKNTMSKLKVYIIYTFKVFGEL